MSRKYVLAYILSLLLMVFIAGSALAEEGGYARSAKRVTSSLINGSEENLIEAGTGVPLGTSSYRSDPPGDTVGYTWYEYQHNGSMGRQVAYAAGTDYSGVHFVWMRTTSEVGPRYIAYNAYDGANWAWPDSGKAFTAVNGGYTTMDVTASGSAVAGWHEGTTGDTYHCMASYDGNPPLAYFDYAGAGAPNPPNCEGWVTGDYEPTSTYNWPVVDWDIVGEDSIIHMVSTESPPAAAPLGEISTLVYYRIVNSSYPSCGTAFDSVYSTSPVVRSDPNSDDVAIVWLHPMYYEGDPNDACGWTQWQNDVYYMESFDGGDHWGSKINVTDYSQGQTLSPEQIPHMAYTDVSALYDSDGYLHIVWSTPLRDIQDSESPCAPLYATRMWHFDQFNDCISLVYDASSPRFHCDTGSWNMSTGKMNISECDGNFYVSFTRFGAHTSANGDTNSDCSATPSFMANGDIFLAGAIQGTHGRTWGPAVNLTDTWTDECAPGECHSEHWSSMAEYSTGVVHIEYIDDRDAGAGITGDEGVMTNNPVKYMTYECFSPDPVCDFGWTPTEVDYPTFIAPNDGSSGCTGGLTTTFDVTLTNSGSMTADYTLTSNATWLVATGGSASGNLAAGCDNQATVTFTIGPIAAEGIYNTTISVSACSGAIVGSIDVTVWVYCEFYVPEYEILSTACWSVGLWNNARAGLNQLADEGNMYWFIDEISLMYDESVVITYAGDTTQTWFSLFDGSDSEVGLVALAPLTTATFATYEYAHGLWANGDTNITGEIEYYLPTHPDTCVLIERIKVCNDEDTTVTIHIGEGIDWDIPDGDDGSENQCGSDASRNMVYQYGPPGGPEASYFGGASFCHENPGAIVLTNLDWVYDNSGYDPAQIGGLLARHAGLVADTPDSLQDMNSFYVVDQDVVLEADLCVVYCKVKASSLTGLADLQGLIDAGKQWIAAPTIDIDDVVYLITYIFQGGPAPVPYASASGDANCSCGAPAVDIDDVVYLITYIFQGGPPPCSCEDWVAACGPLQ
jgi:hypothetical protein